MTLELWIVYALAAFALALTPGPNGLLCLNHAVRFGFRRTVFTALGSITGMLILIALSLAGLGAIMAASSTLFGIVKWVGAAYLVWLGIGLWRARAPVVALAEVTGLDLISRRKAGLQGMLVALSNPKAILFFATFLPQFMQPTTPLWLQFLILGGTLAVIEFGYELVLAGAAQRLAGWLGRHARTFNRVTGAAFIGVGGMVLVTER